MAFRVCWGLVLSLTESRKMVFGRCWCYGWFGMAFVKFDLSERNTKMDIYIYICTSLNAVSSSFRMLPLKRFKLSCFLRVQNHINADLKLIVRLPGYAGSANIESFAGRRLQALSPCVNQGNGASAAHCKTASRAPPTLNLYWAALELQSR